MVNLVGPVVAGLAVGIALVVTLSMGMAMTEPKMYSDPTEIVITDEILNSGNMTDTYVGGVIYPEANGIENDVDQSPFGSPCSDPDIHC